MDARGETDDALGFDGDDTEDVEGHRGGTGEPTSESAGESRRRFVSPDTEEGDDVEGHVQPPHDRDIER